MPFIVTTKRPGHDTFEAYSQGGTGVLRVCKCGTQSDMAENDGNCPYAVSRRAVASLKEARELVTHIVLGVNAPGTGLRSREASRLHPDARQVVWFDLRAAANKIPESGGSVGPLPDGTVIEVEAKDKFYLADVVPHGRYMTKAELIDAFNAREATA